MKTTKSKSKTTASRTDILTEERVAAFLRNARTELQMITGKNDCSVSVTVGSDGTLSWRASASMHAWSPTLRDALAVFEA